MTSNLSSNQIARQLRAVAADAQLVGYNSPAQNALIRGADVIDRLCGGLHLLADSEGPHVDYAWIARATLNGRDWHVDRPGARSSAVEMHRTSNRDYAQPDNPASPVETSGEPRLSTMYVSRICTAYESGFGRGLSKRDVSQPYASGTPEALAYFEGYTRAVAKRSAERTGGSES